MVDNLAPSRRARFVPSDKIADRVRGHSDILPFGVSSLVHFDHAHWLLCCSRTHLKKERNENAKWRNGVDKRTCMPSNMLRYILHCGLSKLLSLGATLAVDCDM